MGRVIFLGTGDPLNGDRAQASFAVPLAGGEAMLFDASSGTVLLRQLETAGILLEGLRHLFVTHRHFDHVGGLAPLLTALVAQPEASLTVHATPRTLAALRDLLSLTIPGVEDWLGGRLRWATLFPGRPTIAGDAEVTSFLVDHAWSASVSGSRKGARRCSMPPTPARARTWSNTRGAPTSSSTKPTG